MKIETSLFEESASTAELERVSWLAFGGTSDSDVSGWFSFDEMRRAIAGRRGICVLASSEVGKLLGFVYAQQENPINGTEGTEKWVIVLLAVALEFAGHGIGSALLAEVERQALAGGARRMFVYTNMDDTGVVEFYEKNGYSDAGWIRDYQHGSGNSAVFLLKYLS